MEGTYDKKMYRGSPFERTKKVIKSVLEHLFDEHKYCDQKWCKVLRERQVQEQKDSNLPLLNPAGPGEHFECPPNTEYFLPQRDRNSHPEKYT